MTGRWKHTYMHVSSIIYHLILSRYGRYAEEESTSWRPQQRGPLLESRFFPLSAKQKSAAKRAKDRGRQKQQHTTLNPMIMAAEMEVVLDDDDDDDDDDI